MNMKKIVMIIVAAALVALPATAQTAQEWQSTSVMQGTGSNLAPQVTAVGATGVGEMAITTTENYSPAKAPASGPHKAPPIDPEPIGDAVLPLLLMSLAFGMFIYFRRKRSAA